MFDALSHEVGAHWSMELDLAALQAELLHALWRAYVAVHSKQNAQIPPPLTIARPDGWRRDDVKPTPMRMIDFALAHGRRS